MARSFIYDTLEMRRFVTEVGTSLTLDELRNAICSGFPEQYLPSRSSLGRYRRYLGIVGTFGNGLRNPAVLAYIHHADRRMTIQQWRAKIEESLPGQRIPNVKAISRYLRRKSARKPVGRSFPTEVYDLGSGPIDLNGEF